MKKLILIVHIILVTFISQGQLVPSSCEAPDSISDLYSDDADQLTIRKIYRNNLPFKDSIHIPKNHSEPILNALIAVYNATALPARDTVTALYSIHTFPDWSMNYLSVAADSTLPWMHQLKLGNIPTGNSAFDNLLSKYDLNIHNYYEFGNAFFWHNVVLTTDSNYNILPLTTLFGALPDVYFSEPESFIGDGNNITDSIYADHIELVYSVAWGDCPSGCIYRRFWKFNVFDDCSVEFVGSYGNPLPIVNVNEMEIKAISAYPNPFTEQINLKGINETFVYSLTDLSGQEKFSGKSSNASIEGLDKLSSGLYFLNIKANQQSRTLRIYRE